MEKKEQDVRNLRQEWEQLWVVLESANTAFNEFLTGGLSVTDGQRIKQFVSKWDKFKDQAELYYDAIDRLTNQQVEPVDIALPWESDEFKAAWQYWKEYLREQHHVHVRSRAEKKMLARLKKIADGDEQKAIEYLDYAESTLYRMFFKVTEKEYTKAPKGAERSEDGDY